MTDLQKIKGGYYLKARKIKESEIAAAPPHVREIWDYFQREAYFKDTENLKRGQLKKSYQDIIDDLTWYVGWRKCYYTKPQCETAMKWLKKRVMITTTKTARGLIITICNYTYYQTPENYENHKEIKTRTAREPHKSDTFIEKNGKKGKNDKKGKKTTDALSLHIPEWLNEKLWNEFKEHRKLLKSKVTPLAETRLLNKLRKFRDAGFDIDEIINNSIEGGWKGIYPPDNKKNQVEKLREVGNRWLKKKNEQDS